MNGGMSTILPPDENTQEMAVDCPNHVLSGKSTPHEVPPPTPLDGSSVINQQTYRADNNLREAAEVASGLPQPDMDFNRIHRIRESIKRQQKQEAANKKLHELMNKDEGAQKLERLRSGGRSKQRPKLTGVENTGYVEDGDASRELDSAEQGIQEMMTSLNQISQHVSEEQLVDDMMFVKRLVQDDSFQRALSMHHTLISSTSTTSQSNKTLPLCPETLYLKTIASDVDNELKFCHIDAADELNKILRDPTVVAIMETHDTVAQTTVAASENMSFLLDIQPQAAAAAAARSTTTPEEDEIMKRVSQHTDKPVRVVTINKTSEALGATVRCETDGTVVIGRIISGGVAEMSGLLFEGDELIEVNNKLLRGMNVNQVGDMIAAMNGNIIFVLGTDPNNQPADNAVVRNPGSEPFAIVKHVRALFDYDAFDDPYLPCRELGLSFQKGEVLRIMSTDDREWWQAHRDSDDDTHLTLAGLIPSQEFQHRRETLRLAISKENVATSDTEETSSLFCGPKKKKRSKAPTPVIEEEEVHTYEDMALYHQPEDKKRPIILIGPPNVGRPELRQRLMENDRERFALPVHYTTKQMKPEEEVENTYNYISREEFARMNDEGQFIEQGSFHKELYATSIASIEKLIRQGKICILTLHAATLPALSSSGLMPYIVFISPPPLEKLRSNMARERRQLKEDELREIIDTAREMEKNYSQFFDETIRNVDLDRSYAELLRLINKLDTEPQWVPARWLD